MRFDELYNSLLEGYQNVDEMAIHLHHQHGVPVDKHGNPASRAPSNKAMAGRTSNPFVQDTETQASNKIEKFVNSLTNYLTTATKQKYSLDELIKNVRTAAGRSDANSVEEDQVSPEAVCSSFARTLVNKLFPGGVNPAKNWSEFTEKGNMSHRAVAEAIRETAEQFSALIGLPVTGHSSHTHTYWVNNNFIKQVVQQELEFSLLEGDEDYIEGSKSSRRKSNAEMSAADKAGRFETHESYLKESPVRIKAAPGQHKQTFVNTLKYTFADKHKRLNEPNARGSDTHHIGDLAGHLSGSTKQTAPQVSVEQAAELFARIVYDAMYDEHGVNPSMNHVEFRNEITKAVEHAIELLEDEHGVDVFSRINNLPKFTARIIDNGMKDMFADVRTGADHTPKTWKAGRLQEGASEGPEDEEFEDDDEDEDGETDEHSSDFAYEHGLLDDKESSEDVPQEEEEEEEEEEDENASEDVADAEVSKIESTGRDIADAFMRALASLDEEEDTEEDDININSDDFDDDEDVSRYIRGIGGVEDEEQDRYSWNRDDDNE